MKWHELEPVAIDPMWDAQQGPQGIPGVQGNVGLSVVGPQGKPGADGLGFNPRGNWKRTTNYEALDVVTHEGSSYIARVPHNRQRPHARSVAWQLLAAKGSKGDRGESTTTLARGRPGRDGKDAVCNAPLEIVFAENVTKGQVIFINENGVALLAQANTESTTGATGFVIAEGQYITEGQITLGDWTALAGTSQLLPGDVYYLSTTNAGSISEVAPTTPGTYVVAVGRAIGPNTLDVEIQLPILLSGNTNAGSASNPAIFDSPAEIGQPLYVSSANHIDLAIANSHPDVIGLATVDGFLSEGQITKADWSTVADSTGLVPGDCYFLSPTNAGQITNIAPTDPGEYVVSLGRAISTDTLEIEIQPAILLTGNATIGSSLTTETFTIAAGQQQITLAQSPSEVTVFLNGLLVTDYEISGNVLTFDCLAENDFVVVKYL